MGCFIALLALFSPRLALVAIWLFSDLLSDAFDSWFLPLLGFFLLPWTTLAYAVVWSTGTNEVSGFEWFIVVLAFLVDLGSYANGRRSRAAYASGARRAAGKLARTAARPTRASSPQPAALPIRCRAKVGRRSDARGRARGSCPSSGPSPPASG